ncbi:aminotransferase class IV family protein [Amycolatopsis sp. 195334CR]|uniref:aminotransferase class IV family protein n=1 Tax=Amycolatopsis sp. 195334CR TaxID=2814588 RepID=UPI001A8F6104|nr:aminotransferase class IV family protein [Amycolatopsis sp. 195334CR]MBN6041084.1 aminotransferase class IV family protein [Amycolatopsis sp. 195334CR]
MNQFVAQLDGKDATAEELAPLAFSGYAHFTALQVRDHRIRGLDLHLDRLREASAEMFGTALPDEQVRAHLRTAIEAGPADQSLTATVFSANREFTVPDGQAELSVLVRTGPAATPPAGPLRLSAAEHERFLPARKQVGEAAKTYLLRQAVAEGFDDAAFLDRRGRISEATIWNLAFWDGTAVVWPEAELLHGITMAIVGRQLDRLGVPQRTEEITLADLPRLTGAVVLNSWTPGIAVHGIDTVQLPAAPSFVDLMHRAYEAEPLTAP